MPSPFPPIRAVLFDLDGTLLDTAPAIARVLNQLCEQYHCPPVPFGQVRAMVSLGAAALLNRALAGQITDHHKLSAEFLSYYQAQMTEGTQPFPQIEALLRELAARAIPWGVVTNKPEKLAIELLQSLSLLPHTQCVIGGDTLSQCKPAPEPILHACAWIGCPPRQVLYLGDALIDMIASKAAGCLSLVASYGYIPDDTDVTTWQADGYIAHPLELLSWLD